MTDWEPATDTEAALSEALRTGDQELYFRILARTDLLLPVADEVPGRAAAGWGTWTTGGRTHVLAFSSVEAMRICLAEHAGSARRVPYHDLAAAWPNQDWWLAINPGLSIEAYLPAWFVGQLSRGDVRLPGRTMGARARVEAAAAARARGAAAIPISELASSTTLSGTSLAAGVAGRRAAAARAAEQPSPLGHPIGSRRSAILQPSENGSGVASAAARPPAAPGPQRPHAPHRLGEPPAVSQPPANQSVPGQPAPGDHQISGYPDHPPSRYPAAHAAPAPIARPASDYRPDSLPVSPLAPAPLPTIPGVPEPAPPLPTLPPAAPLPPRVPHTATGSGQVSPAAGVPQVGPVAGSGQGRAAAPKQDSSAQPPFGASRPEPSTAAGNATPTGAAPSATRPGQGSTYSQPGPKASASVRAPLARTVESSARQPAERSGRARVPAHAAVPDPAEETTEPDFVPDNDVEANLLAAASDGQTDAFLSTLLLARVLVPVASGASAATLPGQPGFQWRREQVEDQPFVVVFTSKARMTDHLGSGADAATVKFVQLIRAWPDESWSFAVNPGTPVGATLPGTQIRALASWAAEVGLSDEPSVAWEHAETPAPASRPEPERPVVMQKPIAPGQVAYFLERSYDRVSGFVHRASEAAHLTTLDELYAALGLAYPGSPFQASDKELYLLRWTAYRPNLYRIPYGGRDETGMRAMQGWVIERPPFRGNGFAPSESSDVIAEFKVDSARLPQGAQMWRLNESGETLVALLDTDGPRWLPISSDSLTDPGAGS